MNAAEFTSHLKILLPEMREIEERLEREFSPAPIGFVSACTEIGWHIALNFRSLSNPRAIFELIELGMVSGDDELKNAIATGLIEALISSSDKGIINWDAVVSNLCPQSNSYAEAWIKFTETGTV